VIDLNPGSRSPQTAAIPIIDNLIRAVPNVTAHARDLLDADPARLKGVIDNFDEREALAGAESAIREGSFTTAERT